MPLGTHKKKKARVDIQEVYRKYSYVVYRRCLRLLQDEAEAHDAQQEVFLSLLERPEAFEERSTLGTYLYSVATFICLGRRRKQSKRNAQWEQKVIEAYTAENERIHFEESVNIKRVLSLITQETDEQTSAIALYYFIDGLSQKEIGKLVGLSRISVNKRLKRFIDTAQRLVKEN